MIGRTIYCVYRANLEKETQGKTAWLLLYGEKIEKELIKHISSSVNGFNCMIDPLGQIRGTRTWIRKENDDWYRVEPHPMPIEIKAWQYIHSFWQT